MKAIHLNLASRPFRDERPFIIVVVVGSLLIAFLTLMNFDAWYRYRSETRDTRAKIASLEKQAENERVQAASLNQKLRAVDTKRLARQTLFANTIIAQRAFSWSELLDRLEHVLPDYVRIESISPGFLPNGMVSLSMQCTARDADGMVKTLNALNHDPHFAGAFPRNLDHAEQGYRFSLGVQYKPTFTRTVQ